MSNDWNDGYDIGYMRGIERAKLDAGYDVVKTTRDWAFSGGVFFGFLAGLAIGALAAVTF